MFALRPSAKKTKKVGGHPTWRSLGPAANAPGNAPAPSGGRFGEHQYFASRIEQVSILHPHGHGNQVSRCGTYLCGNTGSPLPALTLERHQVSVTQHLDQDNLHRSPSWDGRIGL